MPLESAQNRGYFAPQGYLPTPGLRVASDRPMETAQTIRASLLATAIAALLCPRERWTFRAQARSLSGGALADVGRSEHGASALREERTEVGVATLGDAPDAANVTTGVLFGNEAEVTREAASRWEAAQIPNEADDGGRGQKSDAGNGEKSLHLRKLLGERLELVLDASALVLELSNLGARITQVRTEHVGQIRISVFDELGDGGHDEVSALGDEESELAQDPAYGIDACGPCGEPS